MLIVFVRDIAIMKVLGNVGAARVMAWLCRVAFEEVVEFRDVEEMTAAFGDRLGYHNDCVVANHTSRIDVGERPSRHIATLLAHRLQRSYNVNIHLWARQAQPRQLRAMNIPQRHVSVGMLT